MNKQLNGHKTAIMQKCKGFSELVLSKGMMLMKF